MTKEDDSGTGGEPNHETPPVETPPSPADEGGEGKVAYETYKKLLSEKKKLQSEVDKIRKDADQRKQDELVAQQKYKELYESTKTETEQLREKLKSHDERWQDAIKLSAFHDALGDTRRIDPKYTGFIDTTKILVDPDTGKVDSLSVQKEVERVQKDYPEIVKSTITGNLPNQSPNKAGSLSREEWKKLPAKEMVKRRKEVKD